MSRDGSAVWTAKDQARENAQKELLRRLQQPSRVEVQLVKRPLPGSDDPVVLVTDIRHELAVKVILHSKVKKGLSTQGYIDPDALDLEYQVSTMAGAFAEHQDSSFGDNHDPDQVAAAAATALAKLKQIAQNANGRVEAQT